MTGGYEPTSERVTVDGYQATPGDYFIYVSHVATYEFARGYVAGRRVLDFGCGTGYGTHALAGDCRSIVGVDIAGDAIEFAEHSYGAPNLSYRMIGRVEDEPLPFADGAFDTVLSFQVVEHVEDVSRYLAEVCRVLTPQGVFLCATPDRRTRLFRWQHPWNVYHRHEYDPVELSALLRRHFDEVALYGMTTADDILEQELRRCRRMRLLTSPLTLPGVPDRWRTAGLRLLKRLRQPSGSHGETPQVFTYDHTAIRIEAGAWPSTNIVAVARGPSAATAGPVPGR